MHAKRRMVMAVTLLLVVPPPAPAAGPATLAGLVTTDEGNPAVGVQFELVNLDTGRAVTVQTDSNGAFKTGLEPGSYRIEAPQGYSILRGPRLASVASGEVSSVDLVITPSGPPPGAVVGGAGAAAGGAAGVGAAGVAAGVAGGAAGAAGLSTALVVASVAAAGGLAVAVAATTGGPASPSR